MMNTQTQALKQQQIKQIGQMVQNHDYQGIFAEYHGDFETYCYINGKIDRETQTPIQKDTLFGIASGTKFFTALAIGQLIDEGKLTLETRALDVFDLGNPLLDRGMTIRHLLNHTSGLPDYLDESIAPEACESALTVPNHLLITPYDYLPMFPYKANTSKPGEVFKYNNGAYIFLAIIIEKLSGMTYKEYINEKFLRPLGFSRSGVYTVNNLPFNAAKGYYQEDGVEYENTEKMPYQAGGDGGIYTTLMEMKKLWELFLDEKILSQPLVEAYLKPDVCPYPDLGIYYGLGMWLKKEVTELGETFIPYLTGSDIGVSFKTSYHPTLKRFICHISNTSEGVWELNKQVNAFA